jgi:hypothetical protein
MGETTSIISPPRGTAIHVSRGRGEVWGRKQEYPGCSSIPIAQRGDPRR